MGYKFGVALFNDPKKPNGGLNCSDGVVSNFESYADLDASTIWITNVSQKEFQHFGLYRIPYLRRDQYLRISLMQIMRELNIEKSIEGIKQLEGIVHDVAQMLCEKFKINPHQQNYSLCGGLNHKLLSPDELEISQSSEVQTRIALEESYQSLQGALKLTQSGAKLRTYTLPREPHFEFIMNQLFPVNNHWTPLSFSDGSFISGFKNGEKLENTDQVINGLKTLHKNTAVLLNIHVKSINSRYQQGFTFGNKGFNSTTRVWASLPEVIDLLTYAEVEIIEGLQTQNAPLAIRPVPKSDVSRFSYVKGVVAENIWTFLAEKVELSKGTKHYTGIGVYLRAYDRIVCSKLAKAFAKERYQLAGFGVGTVKVWCTQVRSDIEKLDAIAKSYGAKPDIGASR